MDNPFESMRIRFNPECDLGRITSGLYRVKNIVLDAGPLRAISVSAEAVRNNRERLPKDAEQVIHVYEIGEHALKHEGRASAFAQARDLFGGPVRNVLLRGESWIAHDPICPLQGIPTRATVLMTRAEILVQQDWGDDF